MSKVLILGSKGALGRWIAQEFSDHELMLCDREELDITNESQLAQTVSKFKPEIIINCAAYNDVDRAESDRKTANNVNGYAVGYIARAANEIGAIVVHFSTNYVFDGKQTEGYNEDDVPNPLSEYGRSKLLGEMELEKNTDKYFLVRSAWLYGGNDTNGKKSFPKTILDLAQTKTEIDCVHNQYGQPTYVKDLAHEVKSLVFSEKDFGTYHLTNTGSASWYTWAQEIVKMKNLNTKIISTNFENFERPAQRPQNGILNNTKLPAMRTWVDALNEYLNSTNI